jgi:penicillin G amidase
MLFNTIITTLNRIELGDLVVTANELADLRFLLDNFAANKGIGASGLDFFDIPGISAPPEIRRDIVILKSLREALDNLASGQFATAFNMSTNQNEYRWGKLHRITFQHPFGPVGAQFNIPPSGNFEDLSSTLPGLSTDGGYETIDSASINIDAFSEGDFIFSDGPARRYISELRHHGIKSVQIIPGGANGVPGNRFYANQLPSWLTNEYRAGLFTEPEINSNRFSKIVYYPRH